MNQKLASRFFTPTLSSKDRLELFECLGLNTVGYFFLETTGPLVLFAKRLGNKSLTVLEPRNLEEIRDLWGRNANIVQRVFPQNPLPVLSCQWGATRLWKELFPFPFSLFGAAFDSPTQTEITFHPQEFGASLRDLWSAFQLFENRVSQSELSLLWVKNGEARFGVLFHYVRRKCVRVGTSPLLMEVGKYIDQGDANEKLREVFGTHCDVLALDASFSGGGSLFDLAKKLSLLAPPSFRSPSQPERGLESLFQNGL